jgi:thiamine-monophosphate kinase
VTPEFDLISRYFVRNTSRAVLGIGDDCALIDVAAGKLLVVSTDTLVSGTHFFADADAEKLGHKALAVNLSDLAAMGATPRYVTLALTLSAIDHAWLAAFAKGFFALADTHGVELIGGDTTRGPLSITLTVFGEIEQKQALRRDAAKAGDDVWVTGTLGGAALALQHMQGKLTLPGKVFSAVEDRLHRPTPRVEWGAALLGVAHAAIDVSDGLIADLGHICERSNLSATIDRDCIPMSAGLLGIRADLRDLCALAGGDDYELCFTAPPSARARIEAIGVEHGVAVTRVGLMMALVDDAQGGDKDREKDREKVRVLDGQGNTISLLTSGFDHFGTTASA